MAFNDNEPRRIHGNGEVNNWGQRVKSYKNQEKRRKKGQIRYLYKNTCKTNLLRNVDWEWKPPSTYQGVLLVFIGDESNDGKGGKEGKGGFEPMETEELVESKV